MLETTVLLGEGSATGTSLVPTQLRRLLRDTSGPLDRVVVLGGAEAPAPLLAEAAARGIRVLCTYGLTETCSMITLERLEAARRSSGSPLGENHVVIEPAGGVGSIRVAGPSLFGGYLGEPPPTLPFDTGDLGWLDEDGALHVESRRTDLVVTGGENVYPLEIERALLGSGLVDDAIVFGVPHAEWGQEVRALVTGAPRNLAALEAYVRLHLASHKRPKRIRFLAELPTLPNGKIDRRAAARMG